jgi:hypothetical protein
MSSDSINLEILQPCNAVKRMIYLLQKYYNVSSIIAIPAYRLFAIPTITDGVMWVEGQPQIIGRGTPGSHA